MRWAVRWEARWEGRGVTWEARDEVSDVARWEERRDARGRGGRRGGRERQSFLLLFFLLLYFTKNIPSLQCAPRLPSGVLRVVRSGRVFLHLHHSCKTLTV